MFRLRIAPLVVITLLMATFIAPSPAQATAPDSAVVTGSFTGDQWTTQVPLDPSDSAGTTGRGLRVIFWRLDPATQRYLWQQPSAGWAEDSSGLWSLSGISPGTYRIQFVPGDIEMAQKYWDAPSVPGIASLSGYLATATDVTLTAGQTFALGKVSLPADGVEDVTRLAGTDRFGTAVAISQAMYPGSATNADHPLERPNVVYLVNGLNYPDALSAGPAVGAYGGLVLLTLPTSLPGGVAAELKRLQPTTLLVAGDAHSVSDAVMSEAISAAGVPPTAARRLSGPDRYATSDAVVRDAFLSSNRAGADTVFLATGTNYPDALAAGPAAIDLGGPVILVDGTQPRVPDSTLRLIADLGAKQVLLAGSEASISAGIESQLKALFPGSSLGAGVQRLSGANRLRTAGAINNWTFRTTDIALMATAYNFPDALAGAPLAGRLGAPILLTPPDCLGGDAFSSLSAAQANGVVLLGGEPSLSPAVANFTECADFGMQVSYGFARSESAIPPAAIASTNAHTPPRPRTP